MTGPAPAVAAVRHAVRVDLEALMAGSDGPVELVLVACSGGPDSLALAAAVAFVAPRLGIGAGAVVVDHGLQEDSAAVAERAAQACEHLGLRPVQVRRVGPVRPDEASARSARLAALTAAAEEHGAAAVLLGHTLDDQAEQVLLGLARGSGARSLAGMPAVRGVLRRPLLGVRRAVLGDACAAQDLTPWQDPTNHPDGGGARRATVRHVLLPAVEEALGPGMATALARTADLLRADAEVLEPMAADLLARARSGPDGGDLDVEVLAAAPAALRTRALRTALIGWGAPAGALSAAHVAAVDALVTRWTGQGPAFLPGLRVGRRYGRLSPHAPTTEPGSTGGRS
ncbi:tRNA lysidine(34) synthetase TilS [Isoptericola sp. b441]|uniref:tRNA(Ile)-lysidine synthase n=1 Tax=Actinotalea lenta TaxID=3064654 RepID=A0ABT9D8X0_9CELL|nr:MULTISPECIES: tRNA lysidine(34) synthetase TilS [unclassified Isoptericola]MDO8106583.1 tRNA lysidine(34) synthetase TilS [Isoptericola sp. b441]MDO8121709.1 tRNA lysidine(34) synthetase TilS [Isoptericola sp. b490]